MLQNTATAIRLVERGLLPDRLVRHGIRRLLKDRLAELRSGDGVSAAEQTQAFLERIRSAPLALVPEKANAQHYEVPAEFFGKVLGPHRKYSCCLWPAGATTLEQAEEAALAETCEHAGLQDGQRILELGCGWGSLTLWMAARYPASTITAISNSHSQRQYIEAAAARRGLRNVRVQTCDFNVFDTPERFDRIVSVEMFEHLRNWPRAFSHVARWLADDGRFFMHVFAHREAPYPFVARDASDWMSEHFFSGGMMPSDDLALHCQDDLRVARRWRWDGTHYAKTSRAWLDNMDAHHAELQPLFKQVYGHEADTWWTRWRLFFLAVEELFAYGEGQQWWVSHYLFDKRPAQGAA
ncbi:cyclopropane-fatty-acyl-phospholipid synthase family protein [Acidovorax sp. NCPPB 3859]|nr:MULTISPECIES: cyclopropane-fatty-acyl-phospholipid synthase family protein [unclassified Acidovorax]MDA8450420.1 cyclopropane-fatty-acyl-phospholipid synthase family protein [Acidovorax sp. GBBC 3297]MDA8459906.1 cyclopropane-fatty-acyl-phospholipid synthase family protein [Acidovorax sp. GBBC 3333]MDA8464942.1 cyclopropane-fatty-acyl-phospholipid synthase family protein [Acidovorax sp. GBBC 3332]MDA8469935.1 cyclopropane-fatty-acyl-phospholipid synthase family protein [Acidovorax sp. GBBC 3